MSRTFGFIVGVVWVVLASLALQRSIAGWAAGQTDIGFWWAVIATLLAIAAVGALIGTWIHTGRRAAR
jgi:hypothetical protein